MEKKKYKHQKQGHVLSFSICASLIKTSPSVNWANNINLTVFQKEKIKNISQVTRIISIIFKLNVGTIFLHRKVQKKCVIYVCVYKLINKMLFKNSTYCLDKNNISKENYNRKAANPYVPQSQFFESLSLDFATSSLKIHQ